MPTRMLESVGYDHRMTQVHDTSSYIPILVTYTYRVPPKRKPKKRSKRCKAAE